MVRMIPKSSGLACRREFVKEGVSWCDGALIDSDRTVSPVGAMLEKSVPMLPIQNISAKEVDQETSVLDDLQC